MIIQRNCDFIKKATAPAISRIIANTNGDTLSFQISGANGVYILEGRNNTRANWTPLAGINLSDFSAVKGTYTKEGLYEIGIVGVREMRVKVESVEGTVSITGQIISTEET